MPPGIQHPSRLCWDNLSAMKQAKFLAWDQVRSHDENPPAKTPAPKARKR